MLTQLNKIRSLEFSELPEAADTQTGFQFCRGLQLQSEASLEVVFSFALNGVYPAAEFRESSWQRDAHRLGILA